MSKNSKTTKTEETVKIDYSNPTVEDLALIAEHPEGLIAAGMVEEAVATEPKKARKPKRLTEDQLLAKYPHAIAGTLVFETEGHHAGKQTIEADLSCGHVARIATSDLFQVKQCPECKKATKKATKKDEPKKDEPKANKKPLTGAAYNKPVTPAVTLIAEEALTEANA